MQPTKHLTNCKHCGAKLPDTGHDDLYDSINAACWELMRTYKWDASIKKYIPFHIYTVCPECSEERKINVFTKF